MKGDKLEGLLDNYYHFIWERFQGRCPSQKINEAREAIRAYVDGLVRPEAGAWTPAKHNEESLDRAIHSTPGTTWTFWFALPGEPYRWKHTYVLPSFQTSERA